MKTILSPLGVSIVLVIVIGSVILVAIRGFSPISRNQRLWETQEPSTYYMELLAYEHGKTTNISIVVHNGQVHEYESSNLQNSWTNPDFLTVEESLSLAKDYCLGENECTMEFNENYGYLEFWGTSWRGISINAFMECQTASECNENLES